jgi:tetratricopeptide (TPR) repeat protein
MVLGRVEDAIEAYKISIKINPKRLDVYEGLGPLLEELGKREEALKYYDEGLQVDKNDLMINLNKGTLLTEMGRYDEAIACFKAALTKNANAIVTNYRMGNVLTALGKTDEANAHYATTTRQTPTTSWGFCVRGQCFYRLGKKAEAFEDFKKTKEMFAKEDGLLNWTPKQTKFIKDTLTSLLDAEAASGKTSEMMQTLDQNNPAAQKFIARMKKLQEDKTKAQDNVITQMAKRANSDVNTNLSDLDKIKEEFQKNLEEMKAEMNQVKMHVNTLESSKKY